MRNVLLFALLLATACATETAQKANESPHESLAALHAAIAAGDVREFARRVDTVRLIQVLQYLARPRTRPGQTMLAKFPDDWLERQRETIVSRYVKKTFHGPLERYVDILVGTANGSVIEEIEADGTQAAARIVTKTEGSDTIVVTLILRRQDGIWRVVDFGELDSLDELASSDYLAAAPQP